MRQVLPMQHVAAFLISSAGRFFAEVTSLDQSVCDCLFACEGEEWIHEIYFTVYDRIHIILDILRVGGDDRAVIMVVGIRQIHYVHMEYKDRR